MPQPRKLKNQFKSQICTQISKQNGFTLVELLVALAVMVIMAGLSWQGLDVMLKSREITQQRVDEIASLQNVMRQWDADLNAVFPVNPNGTAPGLLNNSNPNANSATSASQPMAIDWDGRVLKMVRRSSTPSPQGADGGLNVVGWTMRDGAWMRWQSPNLISTIDLAQAWSQVSLWAQNPGSDSKQFETLLFQSGGWQIYYFRDNAWSNPLSSSGSGAVSNSANTSSALSNIPDGIRIEVQLPPSLGGTLIKDWVRPAFSTNRT